MNRKESEKTKKTSTTENTSETKTLMKICLCTLSIRLADPLLSDSLSESLSSSLILSAVLFYQTILNFWLPSKLEKEQSAQDCLGRRRRPFHNIYRQIMLPDIYGFHFRRLASSKLSSYCTNNQLQSD